MNDHLFELEHEKLKVNLHPGQTKAWNSEKRMVFVLAGTQGGKSEFGPLWMMREMKRRGAGDYLASSPSYPLMQKKLLPIYLKYFCEILKIGEYKSSERVLFINGTGIENVNLFFGSADNPDSLESATAKAAHLDEIGQKSFRLSSWEAVLRRLSIHQGRVLGTTTIYNLGWLKNEIYDRWKSGDPDIDVIQFESIQNPAFPRAEYDRARRTLPSWKFNMFYRAQFDRPAGMIYDCFSDEQRVPRFSINPEFPRHVGLDFGSINTAAVWVAEEKVNELVTNWYVYREYLAGSKTAKEHAKSFTERSAGEVVANWVGGSKSEEQWRAEFQAAGIPVKEPPISDVEVGIQRVYGLMKTNRLFVFSDCCGVLDEIGTYSRKLDDRGEPTEEIDDKNSFHLLDALRYIIAHVAEDRPPAQQINQNFDRNTARTRKSMWDRMM